MKCVYELTHFYDYGENMEYTKSRVLGIFSTKEEAENAIKMYSKLKGFRDYPMECFNIDKYILDKMCWAEGFIHVCD